MAVAQNGKAYIFGGVLDVDEDEENLEGNFSNEMHALDLSQQVWRLLELSGKKEKKAGKSSKQPENNEMVGCSTAEKSNQGLKKMRQPRGSIH